MPEKYVEEEIIVADMLLAGNSSAWKKRVRPRKFEDEQETNIYSVQQECRLDLAKRKISGEGFS